MYCIHKVKKKVDSVCDVCLEHSTVRCRGKVYKKKRLTLTMAGWFIRCEPHYEYFSMADAI